MVFCGSRFGSYFGKVLFLVWVWVLVLVRVPVRIPSYGSNSSTGFRLIKHRFSTTKF
jgi:hypothetical protein